MTTTNDTAERRRRIVPLLEDTSPTDDDPTLLDDALACVRYLSKIIRDDWDEDKDTGLEWAERIAGLYEQHMGEHGYGPNVGDEAILDLTRETLDEALDGVRGTVADVAAHDGCRVRVHTMAQDPDTDRWDIYVVATLDGPTPGLLLPVAERDLARPIT